MQGDFTRVTFRPRNHYSRVLQQQGRVQLDADWNEQVAIDTYVDRTTTRDLIGGCGAPCDAPAFDLSCLGAVIPSAGCAGASLQLEPGRFYVDGILVENETAVLLGAQPDLPGVALPTTAGPYVAYLDVWEEHLTALERPALREVALGGPDTATRTRTVWQVKLEPFAGGGAPVCSDFGEGWIPAGAESTGRLAARAATSGPITDPCIIPPGAGFRRLENQLYRVEIHDGSQDAGGGAQTPTYKWSRDNATVVLEVSGIVDTVISVTQPARDAVLGFATGDWVEISDEGRTLRGEPGTFVELADAQGTELTVSSWNGPPPVLSTEFATTVRRWESAGAPNVVRGSWIDLEDGVQVRFDNVAAQTYRTGDYWLIPARSADIEGVSTNVGGDVDWPTDPATGQPEFQGRHGIDHHYCAIATLELTTGGGGLWKQSTDCRGRFPSLTDLTQLEYVGGDGQEAMPGDPLPQPLEVGVWNGSCAIESAVVRFSTPDGGTLTGGGGSDASIDVAVGADGIASCTWLLDPDWAKPSQRTRATLLDDHLNPIGLPVDFNANLSIASQVAYDPAGCDALAGEVTVQDAVHHLAAASSLIVRCGDGQEAMPGDPLPQPLEVEVASACGPTEGAQVEFKADANAFVAASVADLASASQTFTAVTGPDGRASVVWLLNAAGSFSQRVEVKLLGTPDGFVEEPTAVCFTGQLSVASQVEYDGGCDNLKDADTVKDALDALCANAGLYYVSGDGQEAAPSTALQHPLQVRVANGGWPTAGVKVIFHVVQGDGAITGDTNVDAQTAIGNTNNNGVAQVAWTLGPNGRQRVEARISEDPSAFTVAFNAQFADTGGGGGTDPERGLHVVAVRLPAFGDLPNDGNVPIGGLIEGIQVDLDGAMDPFAVKAKPILIVTVELPFPEGNQPVTAFVPLVLRGNVDRASPTAIRWGPNNGVLDWLKEQVAIAQNSGVERVLARLVLKGNFIWSRVDPSVFVDGDAFGTRSPDGRTEILRDAAGLMSGDGHRGGDYEMWFYLVPG